MNRMVSVSECVVALTENQSAAETSNDVIAMGRLLEWRIRRY